MRKLLVDEGDATLVCELLAESTEKMLDCEEPSSCESSFSGDIGDVGEATEDLAGVLVY